MLTFLSQSIRQLLDVVGRRQPAPALRALPPSTEICNEISQVHPSPARVQLRLAGASANRDIPIAPAAAAPAYVGATAFVAGQGARIYSLDVFRHRRGPPHPKAA